MQKSVMKSGRLRTTSGKSLILNCCPSYIHTQENEDVCYLRNQTLDIKFYFKFKHLKYIWLSVTQYCNPVNHKSVQKIHTDIQ